MLGSFIYIPVICFALYLSSVSANFQPGKEFGLRVMHSGSVIHLTQITVDSKTHTIHAGIYKDSIPFVGRWDAVGHVIVNGSYLTISPNGHLTLTSNLPSNSTRIRSIFNDNEQNLSFEKNSFFVARKTGSHRDQRYEIFYQPASRASTDVQFVPRITYLDGNTTVVPRVDPDEQDSVAQANGIGITNTIASGLLSLAVLNFVL